MVYRDLARRRDGQEREILLGLAEAEERHAAYWERRLVDQVGRPRRATLRARLLVVLARWFGWVFVLALTEQAERRLACSGCGRAGGDAGRRTDARRGRAGLAARGRARMSSTLRAAVFGANDGLVGNDGLGGGGGGGGGGGRVGWGGWGGGGVREGCSRRFRAA